MRETIFIIHPRTEQKAEVYKDSYITAKWKDLVEFGYETLTRETVQSELENLLNNRPVTVIGEFMRNDLWREDE